MPSSHGLEHGNFRGVERAPRRTRLVHGAPVMGSTRYLQHVLSVNRAWPMIGAYGEPPFEEKACETSALKAAPAEEYVRHL